MLHQMFHGLGQIRSCSGVFLFGTLIIEPQVFGQHIQAPQLVDLSIRIKRYPCNRLENIISIDPGPLKHTIIIAGLNVELSGLIMPVSVTVELLY